MSHLGLVCWKNDSTSRPLFCYMATAATNIIRKRHVGDIDRGEVVLCKQ